MVVAAGAGDGQAQEGLAHHVEAVVEGVGLGLAQVHGRPLAFGHPEEGGAEDRLVVAPIGEAPRLVEQVAGEVFEDEPDGKASRR